MGELERILARWRRSGKGVWRVTLVIDGYDEVFTLLYPGYLSEKKARKLAVKELARAEGESKKHVHITHLELRDLP